ncbi:transcriptional repressor [Labrenzia sp. 011]|nr:transcriptional repressor [Labrenzia sp. 011]
MDERKGGRNSQLVFEVLAGSDRPMTAYQLLAVLRGQGLKAPLQVYRALDQLIDEGLVHKIESLSAFALCTHCEAASHEGAAFTICVKCGRTEEIHDTALGRLLGRLACKQGFRTTSTTVELSGVCEACSNG